MSVITEEQISLAANDIRAWRADDNDNRTLAEVLRDRLWGPSVKVGDTLYAVQSIREDGPMDRIITIMEVGDKLTVLHPPRREDAWCCYVKGPHWDHFRVFPRDVSLTPKTNPETIHP
jgi:hypothetical protein